MSLTTSEQLQKELSIIFGFTGREDIQVGDIIGVGKLTKKKVNELIFEVLRYLNAYNGMLRDYSGTEIFAIEFELKDFNENRQDLKLMPRSMVLVPGEYKDCNILLLGLTHETSLLDVHKARLSIDNLGKLFFEVEEIVERPDFKKSEKEAVLSKFAHRFARKVQGELLEGKWNKKLVGFKSNKENARENMQTFLTFRSDYEINWNHINRDISIQNPRYQSKNLKLSDSESFEFLKWMISGPSAFYIVQNTLQLGANLLRIANTGSVNESQEQIVNLIISQIENELASKTTEIDIDAVISEFKTQIQYLRNTFEKFYEDAKIFCRSGNTGNLSEIIKIIYEKFDTAENKNKISLIHKILEIQHTIIKQSKFGNAESIRAIELMPCFDYFNQIAKLSFKIIENNYQRYFSYIYLLKLYKKLMLAFKAELLSEEKPARTLGEKFSKNFSDKLIKKIHEHIINYEGSPDFNKAELNKIFQKIVEDLAVNYINQISIKINDLIGFAEIMLGDQAKKISKHLDNIRRAQGEFSYLLSFILRYSSLNRFLKDYNEKDALDPKILSDYFYKFMWKRIGGMNLIWKDYILEIIQDFGTLYQKEYEKDYNVKKFWSKSKVSNLFIDYLKSRITESVKPEIFVDVLDNYIAKIPNPTEQALMLLFFEQYEYSLSILDEFPNYMKQKILKILNSINFNLKPILGINYLKPPNLNEIVNENSRKNGLTNYHVEAMNLDIYRFIDEFELKYFSKLIARPSKIILRGVDKGNFTSPLFYNFDFKFWEDFFKLSMSSNWSSIQYQF